MEDDDPSDEDDARCVATKGECDAAHAEVLSWHIDHAVDILGENVGPLDTANGETHNVMRSRCAATVSRNPGRTWDLLPLNQVVRVARRLG